MVRNSEKICPVKRTPHFFKVVLPDLTTHHLRIPPEFMKHISEEESDIAILKGPSGGQWHVKLCKTKDGTYLQDGWQDFVRDHSLCYYEFLVFQYDGNMCFNVKVFDKSGYERNDVFTSKTQEGPIIPIERKFVSYAGKKRGRPPKRCAGSADLFPSRACYGGKKRGRPPKKCAGSANQFPSKACQRDSGIEEVAEKRIKTEDVSMPTCERGSQARRCLSRRIQKTVEQAKVLEAAESFSSSRPYFTRCLNWSSVCGSLCLYIPRSFSKTHLPQFSSKIILRNQRGKDWIVNLKCAGENYFFVGGWTAFARGNKLEIGEICIFELVGKCEFCVHHFPVGPRS